MLSQQLEDNQASLQDETKAKLAVQAKLRAADEERNNLQQDLDEMEDMKLAAEKDKSQAQQQVCSFWLTVFMFRLINVSGTEWKCIMQSKIRN